MFLLAVLVISLNIWDLRFPHVNALVKWKLEGSLTLSSNILGVSIMKEDERGTCRFLLMFSGWEKGECNRATRSYAHGARATIPPIELLTSMSAFLLF